MTLKRKRVRETVLQKTILKISYKISEYKADTHVISVLILSSSLTRKKKKKRTTLA